MSSKISFGTKRLHSDLDALETFYQSSKKDPESLSHFNKKSFEESMNEIPINNNDECLSEGNSSPGSKFNL